VDRSEFLQTSHLSEPDHGPLSSSKWQMRILCAIIQPAASFLPVVVPNNSHRSAIGPQFVGHDDPWLTVAFHRFPLEFQRCFTISPLRNLGFQHFTFVINGPPKVMHLSVDLYENLIQMPLPVGV
jgi:hypothetical protein